ncbi:hypothetical protein KX729_27385 [Rhizobium sp. XQZ8]|nr:hypothetical protein [Rhizobium populisoli]MBW6425169.1 hypothetical protein [Rhizobium populisoli]
MVKRLSPLAAGDIRVCADADLDACRASGSIRTERSDMDNMIKAPG